MTTRPADPSQRTHVLQLVGNGIVGGMELHVERLLERLPRDRFATTVLCPFECDYAERLRELGIEVLIVPMPMDNPLWSAIQAVCAIVRGRSIDVLHAHMANAHTLAALAGKLCGKPVLSTIHAGEIAPPDLEAHRNAGTWLNMVCRYSWLHALGMGADPARLSLIPNGVDLATFRPGRADGAGLRAQLGLAEDTPLIGFVGRLSHEKGPDLFLNTALRLHEWHAGLHFVMAGDGPMHGQLAAFADSQGLGACVHLLGTRDDVPALWRDVDVALLTSHSEAAPLSLMEAMASGVPVVATRVGGVPELVSHGRTGWLVPPNDAPALADNTMQLLRTPGVRERMGANARAWAVERLDLDACVRLTGELLRGLAHPTARPGDQQAGSHGTPSLLEDQPGLSGRREPLGRRDPDQPAA